MNITSLTELLQIAGQRPQSAGTVRALLGAGADFGSILSAASAASSSTQSSGVFDLLATTPTAKTTGLSATGRNTALFDPEAAYSMMTTINTKEVTYKAQFSSLDSMGDALSGMAGLGRSLAILPDTITTADLRDKLQGFADAYNQWRQEFDDEMRSGGVLAGTQAAKVARHELDQSVGNMFFGAMDGVRGLKDLGLSLSPVTRRLSFDAARFDAIQTSNPQGVLATLREFGSNFARSAELLTSDGNFVQRQLDNLDRAIDFIGDSRAQWQQEFGTGDVVEPKGALADALRAYNQRFGQLDISAA